MSRIVSLKIYTLVWAALMLLLLAAVGVHYISSGFTSVALSLSIAAVKAVLVILFFMHVRYSKHVIWLTAAAGFFWLGILIGLGLADYMTRTYLPVLGK